MGKIAPSQYQDQKKERYVCSASRTKLSIKLAEYEIVEQITDREEVFSVHYI